MFVMGYIRLSLFVAAVLLQSSFQHMAYDETDDIQSVPKMPSRRPQVSGTIAGNEKAGDFRGLLRPLKQQAPAAYRGETGGESGDFRSVLKHVGERGAGEKGKVPEGAPWSREMLRKVPETEKNESFEVTTTPEPNFSEKLSNSLFGTWKAMYLTSAVESVKAMNLPSSCREIVFSFLPAVSQDLTSMVEEFKDFKSINKKTNPALTARVRGYFHNLDEIFPKISREEIQKQEESLQEEFLGMGKTTLKELPEISKKLKVGHPMLVLAPALLAFNSVTNQLYWICGVNLLVPCHYNHKMPQTDSVIVPNVLKRSKFLLGAFGGRDLSGIVSKCVQDKPKITGN